MEPYWLPTERAELGPPRWPCMESKIDSSAGLKKDAISDLQQGGPVGIPPDNRQRSMNDSPAERELPTTDADCRIVVLQTAELNIGWLFLIFEHGLGGLFEVVEHRLHVFLVSESRRCETILGPVSGRLGDETGARSHPSKILADEHSRGSSPEGCLHAVVSADAMTVSDE